MRSLLILLLASPLSAQTTYFLASGTDNNKDGAASATYTDLYSPPMYFNYSSNFDGSTSNLTYHGVNVPVLYAAFQVRYSYTNTFVGGDTGWQTSMDKRKSFMRFDTSSLGAGATITAASLHFYASSVSLSGTPTLTVYTISNWPPAVNTTDYNGGSVLCTITAASLSGAGYKTCTIASGAFSQISKTGFTNIRIQLPNPPANYSAGTWTSQFYIQSGTSDSTTNPYLSITTATGGARLIMVTEGE
jgi:hypothetical protein